MKKGNMDRTLFLGNEVEEWFEGFEAELRELLAARNYMEGRKGLVRMLRKEILGES